MLRKIREYQRFKIKDKTYILTKENNKMVLVNIMGNDKIVSIFNYPKQLRLLHLWLLGILEPSEQHVPFNSNKSIYAA